jgi:Tol biopolymer transport system component
VRNGLSIEDPTGKPIVQRTTGWIDMLRVSPDGKRIAYLDHPAKGDTAGQLVVVTLEGKELARSSPQVGIEGLAWSPDGTEAWFSNSATIYGVDMQKRERVVLRGGTSRLVLLDVAGTSILVAPTDLRLKMFTGPRSGPFREVSWFDSSDVESMSADGSAIAFYEDAGTGMTKDGYAHFFRRGDQPPSLLTHGYHMALTPDGSAALVIGNPKKLTRVPTGIGASASFELGPIQELDIGDFVAMAWQGRYGVVRGNDSSGASKLWRVDLENPAQPPQLVLANAPSGMHPISPDGSLVAVPRESGGGIEVVSMAGARAITFDGTAGDSPVSFTGDGTAIFVSHVVDTTTIQIDRIELATKARSPWLSISPEQPPVYYTLALDAAGEHVTYSTNSDASDLYVLQPPAKP